MDTGKQEVEATNLLEVVPPTRPGYLAGRIGPMTSGKSSWLDIELTRFADIGLKVLKVNTVHDVRLSASADDSGTSHSSTQKVLSAKIDRQKVKLLQEVDVTAYEVIGVDECNFYEDLVVEVIKWVEKLGKHVLFTGLDGDFEKKPFGQTLQLIPYADECIKMNATCLFCLEEDRHNLRSAPFSRRLIKDDRKILVGGAELYVATCRRHHVVL